MKTLVRILVCAAIAHSFQTFASENRDIYLVKDINKATGSEMNPRDFVPLDDGRVVFLYGSWGVAVSDGTTAGTSIVYSRSSGNAERLMTLSDSKAIFVASGLSGEKELWSTDGTREGTTRLAAADPYPTQIATYEGGAYFVASFPCKLWQTDGTLVGTKAIGLIRENKGCPQEIALFNDRLFFIDADGLWQVNTDGSEVKQVAAGYTYGSSMVDLGDRLIGSLSTPLFGHEPFAIDRSGVFQIIDLNPGTEGSFRDPSDFTVANGVAYFRADSGRLWRTDGSLGGSYVFSGTYVQRPPPTSGTSGRVMCASNEALYFTGYAVEGNFLTKQLWKLDLGTGLVEPIPSTATVDSFTWLTAFKHDVYFVKTSSLGLEVWSVDGTTGQSVLVKDIYPGPRGANPSHLTVIHDHLWFAARSDQTGREVWISDGSPTGTRELANLARDYPASADPHTLTPVGNRIYFAAQDSSVFNGLWTSDGTYEGTALITDKTSNNFSVAPLGSRLFVWVDQRLWTVEGEELRLALHAPGATGGMLLPFGDKVFLSARESYDTSTQRLELLDSDGSTLMNAIDSIWIAGTQELYKSDGTASGTYAISPMSAELKGGRDVWLGGQALRFTGGSLYASQGSSSGYTLIKQNVGSPKDGSPTVGTTRAYWVASGGAPDQLWVTDGTTSGTKQLLTAYIKWSGSVTILGDSVFFVVYDDTHGEELWTSDGTASGTRLVADINPGLGYSSPKDLAAIDGFVYFSADDGLTGRELWRVGRDLRPELVADIEAGKTSSSPKGFASTGSRLFFAATTQESGNELRAMTPDSTPSLSVIDATASEGQDASVRVVMSRPSTSTTVVRYRLEGITATPDVDYENVSGSIEIQPGETEGVISIPILDDEQEEEPHEGLAVIISSGARLHKDSGVVVIQPSQLKPASLKVDIEPVGANKFVARVLNQGTRTATGVRIEAGADRPDSTLQGEDCLRENVWGEGHDCVVNFVSAGEAIDAAFQFGDGLLAVAAFAREGDDDASDNVAYLSKSGRFVIRNRYVPRNEPETGFLWASGASKKVSLRSSDESIAMVPPEISISSAPAWVPFQISGGENTGVVTIDAVFDDGTTASAQFEIRDRQAAGKITPTLSWKRSGPTAFGGQQELTVTVGLKGIQPRPEGAVSLYQRGVEMARGSLVDGSVRFPLNWPVGAYYVQVAYSGDANYDQAATRESYLAINVTHGYVTISQERDSVLKPNEAGVISFRIVGTPSMRPTGKVTLFSGGTQAGEAELVSGTSPGEAIANVAVPPLVEGLHMFDLTYSGDVSYRPAQQVDIVVEVRETGRRRGVRR